MPGPGSSGVWPRPPTSSRSFTAWPSASPARPPPTASASRCPRWASSRSCSCRCTSPGRSPPASPPTGSARAARCSSGLALMAAGEATFALAHCFGLALAGRALVGLGRRDDVRQRPAPGPQLVPRAPAGAAGRAHAPRPAASASWARPSRCSSRSPSLGWGATFAATTLLTVCSPAACGSWCATARPEVPAPAAPQPRARSSRRCARPRAARARATASACTPR